MDHFILSYWKHSWYIFLKECDSLDFRSENKFKTWILNQIFLFQNKQDKSLLIFFQEWVKFSFIDGPSLACSKLTQIVNCFSQLQFKLYHEVLKNMAQNCADAFLPKAWNIQEVKSSCIFPIVSLKWYQLHLMRGEMVLP